MRSGFYALPPIGTDSRLSATGKLVNDALAGEGLGADKSALALALGGGWAHALPSPFSRAVNGLDSKTFEGTFPASYYDSLDGDRRCCSAIPTWGCSFGS